MKLNFTVLIVTLCIILPLNAQVIKKAEWSRTKMDSSYNAQLDKNGNYISSKTGKIIAKYKPKVDSLDLVIGYVPMEIKKHAPESPLSNMAADIIRHAADKYMAENDISGKTDIAITNFGGIRTDIKAGNITVSDVMQVFPFENKIVILNLQGDIVKRLIDNFAKKERVEAISGVKLKINQGVVEEFSIGGQQLDENRIYKIATIDFLLGGGDGFYLFKKNDNTIQTGIIIRDAVINYIKELTARGENVSPKEDGRVVIIKKPKNN